MCPRVDSIYNRKIHITRLVTGEAGGTSDKPGTVDSRNRFRDPHELNSSYEEFSWEKYQEKWVNTLGLGTLGRCSLRTWHRFSPVGELSGLHGKCSSRLKRSCQWFSSVHMWWVGLVCRDIWHLNLAGKCSICFLDTQVNLLTDIHNIWQCLKQNSKENFSSCQAGMVEFTSYGNFTVHDSRISPNKRWICANRAVPLLIRTRHANFNDSLDHGGIWVKWVIPAPLGYQAGQPQINKALVRFRLPGWLASPYKQNLFFL